VAVLVTTSDSPLHRLLATKVVAFIGLVSYSLYLIHNAVAGPAFHGGTRFLEGSAMAELIVLVLVTAIQVVCAWIWFRTVERPAIAWSQRLRRPASDKAAVSS
jgi:peptidoglycan/LPS O-acetylase OafA/YrhL